jgi:hypothetical protein
MKKAAQNTALRSHPLQGPLFRLKSFLGAAAATMLIGTTTHAAPAVGFDTTYYWNMQGGPGVYGWQFTPRATLRVSALGLFDNFDINGGGFPGDGFLEAHEIGIWSVAGSSYSLLSSATIPAGGAAPLADGFRYVEVAPVDLTPGLSYVIAARYPSTNLQRRDWLTGRINNPSFVLSLNSSLEFGGRRSGGLFSPTLVFPTTYQPGEIGDFGPNFTFTVVPEPSSAGVLLLCAGLLPIMKRRK